MHWIFISFEVLSGGRQEYNLGIGPHLFLTTAVGTSVLDAVGAKFQLESAYLSLLLLDTDVNLWLRNFSWAFAGLGLEPLALPFVGNLELSLMPTGSSRLSH